MKLSRRELTLEELRRLGDKSPVGTVGPVLLAIPMP